MLGFLKNENKVKKYETTTIELTLRKMLRNMGVNVLTNCFEIHCPQNIVHRKNKEKTGQGQ